MKYLIHIILLFLILGKLEGQSISLYPKKGKKIKIDSSIIRHLTVKYKNLDTEIEYFKREK